MLEQPEDALPEDFVDAELTRAEAANYLATVGVRRTIATLAKLHATGAEGPPCVHRGRTPIYDKRALHAWAMRKLIQLRRGSREREAQSPTIAV